MICPNCNREIPDGSNICGYCSADLRSAGNENPYSHNQRPQNSIGPSGKPKLTTRGILVLGGILVVVILLVVLLVTIFRGGGEDPANPAVVVPTTQPIDASPTFLIYGQTQVPEGYVDDPGLEDDPLANLPTMAPATPEPTEMPEFTETYRNGDTGEGVQDLQVRLIYHGFLEGEADGQYGPATAEAVRKLQEDSGLAVDGRAGPETLRTLYALPFDETLAETNLNNAPGAQENILSAPPDVPG